MKLLRRIVSLLLFITLPVYGLAGVIVDAKPPCPMQMDGKSMADHPCCVDQDDGGHPCKPGQECKSSGLFQLLASKPTLDVPESGFSPSAVNAQPLPCHSPPIWHPPRA